jgi:hypothetical protein
MVISHHVSRSSDAVGTHLVVKAIVDDYHVGKLHRGLHIALLPHMPALNTCDLRETATPQQDVAEAGAMRALSANMVRLPATAVGSCGGRGSQSVPPLWKCFWFRSLSFFKNSAILLSNVNDPSIGCQ